MTIYSFSPFGYEGALVTVEVDLRRGIPATDMVGLADGAVRESRERVRAAVQNSGLNFPLERILISLSPADVKKEGAGFDLAIALAVLAAADSGANGDGHAAANGAVLVMGELELSGKVRPVRGIHAAVESALEQGITRCIVPQANAPEAQTQGMHTLAADSLAVAWAALCASPEAWGPSRQSAPSAQRSPAETVDFPPPSGACEFAEVKGQPALVRGLQIAAAGGHNLLAYGPPGCGKTLALSRFPALLPLLTSEEARPVTRIHSLAGNMPHGQPLIRVPPFRMPHQSTSLEGMTGGGKNCGPGEISLAHHGVLFLDEAAEFKVNVLQSLRVSLETGTVTVSRAGRSSVYPASYQLLIATNPCSCGNFGSPGKVCVCSMRSVEQYWRKFSAPLLDRIDIRIPVFPPASASRSHAAPGTVPPALLTTAGLRRPIAHAVAAQRCRQGKRNQFLLPEELSHCCLVDDDASQELDMAVSACGFSPRARASCLKLARTIADMEGSGTIRQEHMAEAISFRKNEGVLSFDF
ncbi:MAG: YifB family Mg chelatase-like AAA ATPase [Spirochaetaceae bacterium]|nr:YifB family Mg chelatase-like AAA ATPase [Spirochaetaceae bacterium]